MANIKISALPSSTANTLDSWFVVNNSGETLTQKSQVKYSIGLTNGDGANSMQSNDFLTTSGTTATGSGSIALGNGTQALNSASISIGQQSYATREGDIAIGLRAGTNIAESNNAVAIGTDSYVIRSYGIAIGYDAVALEDGIAIGRSTRPIGDTCMAIGKQNFAAGNRGYAIGASIWCDKDDAGGIGSNLWIDGLNSLALGAYNYIGQSGGACNSSVAIGNTNTISGASQQIVIGSNNVGKSQGLVVISSDGIDNLQNSENSVVIGSTGTTISASLGQNAVVIGGVNNTMTYPISECVVIGGSGNTYNAAAGTFNNNVLIGLNNRTPASTKNNTAFFENIFSYGQIEQQETTYDGSSSTVDVDISSMGVVVLEATGGTYNIDIQPVTSNVGLELTLMIKYFSAATINFVSGGLTQWKWGNGAGAPVFSGDNNYNILVFRAWNDNNLYEQSRSMWMSA